MGALEWTDGAAPEKPTRHTWTGTCLCFVKRVTDEQPFALVTVPVYQDQSKPSRWWFQRPLTYKQGGRGVSFKLLTDTYAPFREVRLDA